VLHCVIALLLSLCFVAVVAVPHTCSNDAVVKATAYAPAYDQCLGYYTFWMYASVRRLLAVHPRTVVCTRLCARSYVCPTLPDFCRVSASRCEQSNDACPASMDSFDITVGCSLLPTVNIGVDVTVNWNGSSFVNDQLRCVARRSGLKCGDHGFSTVTCTALVL
jgi:hypothetical protein